MSMDKSYADIDVDRLDAEWLSQPKMFADAAQDLADAEYEYDLAKAELELVIAELDHDIRLFPEKYGVEKISEPAVKQATIRHKRHQEADRKLMEANYRLNLHKAEVNTLGQRKAALEDLVKLRLADYFSTPRTPKGVTSEVLNEREKKDFSKRTRPKARPMTAGET